MVWEQNQKDWLRMHVNSARANGHVAQREALRAALRQVAANHKLLAPTGQFYSDGVAQTGDQPLYDEAFDRRLASLMERDPKTIRRYAVGTRKPLYPKQPQMMGETYRVQANINDACVHGVSAQRQALRAALRLVAPRHPLLMPTGRVYSDGSAQIGDQVLYDKWFDKWFEKNIWRDPKQHRACIVW
jgi:hypothetical protein